MLRFTLAVCASILSTSVGAVDVGVVGLFPGKAVLVVDGAAPKTYSVGATIEGGAKLVAVDGNSATIEVNGKRANYQIGQHVTKNSGSRNSKVTLHADQRGHFYADTQINGVMIRMLVDTGATSIAISAADANRLGIVYRNGKRGYSNTANGTVQVYGIKLDTVRVGDVELHSVDAVVLENGLSGGLLGNSFLNRTEMHRDGAAMTLTKRF